jgi:osmotically-inducible protein OsmY
MDKSAPVELLETVMAALESDTRLDVRHHPINVSLREGSLVLDGTLETIAAKRLATTIVHQVARGFPVSDQLRVVASKSREEGVLRNEACNTLLQEPVFTECSLRLKRNGTVETLRQAPDGCTIDLTIQNGVVTLEGYVGSLTHWRLAEVLVWWTAGCELVENRLEVIPPEEDNDGELTDAVRMVLEKDPLVHAGQLSIRVRAGTVTLNGAVASQEEKRLAVLDAWYVVGVQAVVDNIETR